MAIIVMLPSAEIPPSRSSNVSVLRIAATKPTTVEMQPVSELQKSQSATAGRGPCFLAATWRLRITPQTQRTKPSKRG